MRTFGLGILTILRLLLQRDPARDTFTSASRVDAWCRSWSGCGVALVVLCAVLYIPGLKSIPPVDRDESRFAQASRQMFESGDYLVPRVQDRPRLNKPPLIYWLQCGSIALFGDREGQYSNANIWVFRVPSVLCAIGSVLITWRLGVRMLTPRGGALAGVMLALCPIVLWDAHQARADQLLLLCTTATMLALWRVWSIAGRAHASAGSPAPVRGSLFWAMAFWVALALGVLAKGPITPLVAGLTILTLCVCTRRWRWTLRLRPLLGAVMVLMIVSPWVIAVGERVGWQTYLSTIYDETIARSGGAKEGHWGPPGYHLALLAVLFWPGVLLTAAGVQHAVTRLRSQSRNARAHSPELFLLCWIVPAWVVFELIATKLPHYTMPMYPAIALLSARAVLRASAGTLLHAPLTLGTKIGMGFWLLVAMCVVAAPAVSTFMTTSSRIALIACIIVLILAGVLWIRVLRAILHARYPRALTLSAAIFVLCSVCFFTLGARSSLPGSKTVPIVKSLHGLDPAATRPIASEYHEDSLIFWTRGRAQRINPDQRESWLNANPTGIVITKSRDVIDRSQSPPSASPPH